MIVYLATFFQDREQGPALTRVSAMNRLHSYHLVSEAMKSGMCEKDALVRYCKTGEYDTRKSIRGK